MTATAWDPTTGYQATTALIVVDVQNDFADAGGSLYVPGGETIIEAINEQIERARAAGSTIVSTQDWHPPESPHFVAGGGKWPPHCVRRTWGAELHPSLDRDADLVLRKGTGGEDGYSAFSLYDPRTGESHQTGLAACLRERDVSTTVVVGLAADVCVQATALDAARLGFQVIVPWPMTRPIATGAEVARAAVALRHAGVAVLDAPA